MIPAPVSRCLNSPKVILRYSAVALVALACGAAQAAEPMFEAKSEESIRIVPGSEPNSVVIEQQRVNYHHITQFAGETVKSIVVRETLKQSTNTGVEGGTSDVTVDLFQADSMGKYPGKPTKTLSIPQVQQCEFDTDFWSAVTQGCCGAEDYGRLYTYGADKPFLRYTANYWTIEVPNTQNTRYVSVVGKDDMPSDAAREALFGKAPKAIAAVSLAGLGKPLDVAYIYAKDGLKEDVLSGLRPENLTITSPHKKDESSGERSLTLWSQDGSVGANKNKTSVSGALITVSFYAGDTTESLGLKLEADRLVPVDASGQFVRFNQK
jgi:hypothetical protein